MLAQPSTNPAISRPTPQGFGPHFPIPKLAKVRDTRSQHILPSSTDVILSSSTRQQYLPTVQTKVLAELEEGAYVNVPNTLVIIGDVPEGSYVQAGGDIFITGRAFGNVWAGYPKNNYAMVHCGGGYLNTIRIGTALHPPGPSTMLKEKAVKLVSVEPGSMVMRAAAFTDQYSKVHMGMKGMGRNMYLTGLYAMVLGLVIVAMPHKVFGIFFDVSTISKGWARLMGLMMSLFGMYYLAGSYGEATGFGLQSFAKSTVYGRLGAAIILTIIVAMKELSPIILVIAGLNALGAFAMSKALAKQSN